LNTFSQLLHNAAKRPSLPLNRFAQCFLLFFV